MDITPPFKWFLARVTNRNDPNKLGRVQIRVFNIHPENVALVPDEALPWAVPLQGVSSASLNGVGIFPTGLLKDSIVWGFFLDGEECQIPVIGGTFSGTGDPPPLAIGQNTTKSITGPQPASPFAAQYPFNRVVATESGHLIEIDDTPGSERIHVFHRSGSFMEIDASGTIVTKAQGDNYTIVTSDNTVYTSGKTTVIAVGDVDITTFNDTAVNISGGLNLAVREDLRIRARNIFMEAEENIYVKAGENIATDAGGDLLLEGGAASASGLQRPADRRQDQQSEGNARIVSLSNDDFQNDADATAFVEAQISAGALPPETASTESTTEALSMTNTQVPPQITACGIVLTGKENIDDVVLTPNFTVGKLSTFCAVTKHRVRAQRDITEGEIVCNLKALSENCLEKIRSQFPSMVITSGFRDIRQTSNPNSQHCLGQAADIQYRDITGSAAEIRKEYFDRATWIVNNVAFDQFLLEFQTTGGRPWHHISFSTSRTRYDVRTFLNHRSKGVGLQLLNI